MHVYRRQQKGGWDGDHQRCTGSKNPQDYIEAWQNTEGVIWFNGSSDDATKRRVEIGVSITEEDVCALFNAVIKRRQSADDKRHEFLAKICRLIEKHREEAPSMEAFIQVVLALAQHGNRHFSYLDEDDIWLNSVDWIDWHSL
jgi:hypothetical protein